MSDSENECVCSVEKENNLGYYRLHTIWKNDSFRINIASKDASWTGEMSSEKIQHMSDQLETDKVSYFKLCKEALTKDGGAEGVSYVIENNSFCWKKVIDCDIGSKLRLGCVQLEPTNFVETIQNMVNVALASNRNLRSEILQLEGEKEKLQSNKNTLLEKLNQLTKAKNEMETDLYNRFLIVLNGKKKRILELEEGIAKSEEVVTAVKNKRVRKPRSKEVIEDKAAYEMDTEDDEMDVEKTKEIPKKKFWRAKTFPDHTENKDKSTDACSESKKSKNKEYDSDTSIHLSEIPTSETTLSVVVNPLAEATTSESKTDKQNAESSPNEADNSSNNSRQHESTNDFKPSTLTESDHLFKIQSETLKPTAKEILEKFF